MIYYKKAEISKLRTTSGTIITLKEVLKPKPTIIRGRGLDVLT